MYGTYDLRGFDAVLVMLRDWSESRKCHLFLAEFVSCYGNILCLEYSYLTAIPAGHSNAA